MDNSNSKSRVLGFVRTEVGTVIITPVQYYRCWLPLQAVGRYSKSFDVELYTREQLRVIFEMTGSKLEDCLRGRDIYFLSRMYHSYGIGVHSSVEAMHESGAVIFDTDDDLTGEFRTFGGEEGFLKSLRAVDLVTTSTPFLASRLSQYVKRPPVVLPNHLDTEWFAATSKQAPRWHKGLTVGFVGTGTHERDWGYPVEALVRLSKEHDITVLTAGFCPPYLKEIPGLKELPTVPYAEYPALVRQYDIVCCSLDPNDQFNWSKSAVKSLEAMSAARKVNGRTVGAVPVCTDMPVYNTTVKDGINGLLVRNDRWYDALKWLITNESRRIKLAERGHRWVKKHWDIRKGYKLWEKALQDAVLIREENLLQ